MNPMPKILFRALALAALQIVFSWTNASAQQAQPSPLEFVEADPLVLSPNEPAQLQLRNNTSRTLTVSVRVMDLTPADSNPISKHVSISPASGFELQPAGGVILTATLAEGYKIDPSQNVAYLSAFESETNTFARRIIQLKAADTGGGAQKDKPLLTFSTAWSATGHYTIKDTLSLDKSQKPVILDTYLPLAPKAPTDKVSQDKPLAILFNDAGDPGVLEYNKTENLLGGLQSLRLTFKGSGCCGKYKGKINKDVGTDKDDVEVTVVMSHHWLYPLLMLLGGVVTAFFFKERYIGVSRPLLILEEKRAQIEYDFEVAQAAFKKNYASESYILYSIKVVFFRMLEAAGAEIQDLRSRSFSKLDEEGVKGAEASLDELRRLTSEWKTFPSRLAALKTARGALVIDGSTRPPYLTPPPTEPAICASATKLLNNGREMDDVEFRTVSSSSVSLTALLKTWQSLNDEATALWYAIHETTDAHTLRRIEEEKKPELDAVDQTLEGLWYDLWVRDDYKQDVMNTSLEQAAKDIKLLSMHFQDTPTDAAVFTTGESRSVRRTEAAAEAETPQQRSQRYRSWRFILDSLFVLISLLVAIYTGFSQLYIGQAFGTLHDYVKIFLWGFGVQTTLTAVVMGLNLLWNSRSALRLSAFKP